MAETGGTFILAEIVAGARPQRAQDRALTISVPVRPRRIKQRQADNRGIVPMVIKRPDMAATGKTKSRQAGRNHCAASGRITLRFLWLLHSTTRPAL